MVCDALVAGGRLLGVEEQAMRPRTKHVEQIIIAIKHSVASSWFSSLRLYYDARTNIHQIHTSSSLGCCNVFIELFEIKPAILLQF